MRTPPPVPAASIPVTNCNDSGPGSLRDAVNAAADGDTIDMTALACSTITLTSGAIAIGQDNLTLAGPGLLSLELTGADTYRNLFSLGTGTLTVQDMIVSHGKKYLNDGDLGSAGGGCIFHNGTVVLDHAWAKYCDAGTNSTTGNAHGGAIFGQTGVTLLNSFVTANTLHANGTQGAYGGAIYTQGDLTVAYSTISGNSAVSMASWAQGGAAQVGCILGGTCVDGGSTFMKYSSVSNNTSTGLGSESYGALYLTGNANIFFSTISGNHAARSAGITLKRGANVSTDWTINSSTISGNVATAPIWPGGISIGNNATQIKDSTIAFNTAIGANDTKYGAGVRVINGVNVDMQNTIIAGNTTDRGRPEGAEVDDIGGVNTATTSGAANLVFFPSSLVMPPATIVLVDPRLKALSANGGWTSTHALDPLSPAIDVGNNASGATTDQRGSGFPRVIGSGPDIGAFELDLSDVIFPDGFDG
ncbi:MAG TPA: choice-of-anchor Q domain-containing protein [Dokdonella sp.]|nr:choice-of-anchor Q domain-containing protein [Dokdonella sp.]